MNPSLFTTIQGKGILVPEYLGWDFVIHGSVLESIHSKNKRKFLRKTDSILQENEVYERIINIDADGYQQWKNFYLAEHAHKGNELVLTDEWFERNTNRGRVLEGMQLLQGTKLLGMKVYSYDPKGIYFAYKITKKEYDEKLNLGVLLDYRAFIRAQGLGYSVCNMGKSENTFGRGLALSLYEYKISIGMKVRPAHGTKVYRFFSTDIDIADPFILFVFIKNQETVLYVYPDGSIPNPARYKPLDTHFISLPYSEFIKLQENAL